MLKRPASLAIACGVFAIGGVNVSMSASLPPASASAATAWPTLLETSLPGGVSADEVQVFAAPPTSDDEQIDDTRALVPIPASLVVLGSRFSVLVDPVAIPIDYRRSDGIVDFSIWVTDATDKSWTTFRSVRAGALPTATSTNAQSSPRYKHVWVDGLETDDDLTGMTDDSGFPVLETKGPNRGAAAAAADYDDETVDVNPDEFVQVELPVAQGPGNDCLKETYKGDVDRSTTIGTSYPIGTSTSRMIHNSSSSNSSDLGVAVGAKNNNGSMEWRAGGTKYTEGSWTGTWEFAGAKRSYRIQTNYHKYILGEGCHGSVHYRRPHIETGGAGNNTNGLTRPDWNEFCSPQPLDYTFTRKDSEGKAYSYGAAVKFAELIGIDLSIKKAYTGYNMLEYKFTGSTKHKLCGKDDYPSKASKMIDRFN